MRDIKHTLPVITPDGRQEGNSTGAIIEKMQQEKNKQQKK